MFDLSGKTALVTGSSQGMGKEIAKALKDHGATIYAHGSKMSDKLQEAAKYIGTEKTVAADLFDKKSAEELFNQTGGVDILVLNASVQYKKSWDEYTDEEIDNQLNCNLRTNYYMIKTFVPYMKSRKWGRIVTIGSVNQFNNHSELSFYGVTKAAQMKMVQSIAPYIAPYGITINNIAPGAIATPRNAAALENADFKEKLLKSIPVGYVGDAKSINGAALLLCSDEGSYITGSEIIADGGMHL